MYRVEFTPGFERDIRRLDKPDALRIIEKIEWLADNPHAVRYPLKHMPDDLRNLHKYRIGPWRVFLWIDHEERVISVFLKLCRQERFVFGVRRFIAAFAVRDLPRYADL